MTDENQLEKDVKQILCLFGERLEDMGRGKFLSPENVGFIGIYIRILIERPNQLEDNKMSIYKILTDIGYDLETIRKVGMFKDYNPQD